MKSYEQLKAVIQAANPEIMELRFGCEVATPEGLKVLIGKSRTGCLLGNYRLGYSEPYLDRDIKSLGRPIRLADVLLALYGTMDPRAITVNTRGQIAIDDGRALVYCFWNLKDDNLDHQSDETKQFLVDLLVPVQEDLE